MELQQQQQIIAEVASLSLQYRLGKIEKVTFDSAGVPTIKYFAFVNSDGLQRMIGDKVDYKFIDSYRLRFPQFKA